MDIKHYLAKQLSARQGFNHGFGPIAHGRHSRLIKVIDDDNCHAPYGATDILMSLGREALTWLPR